ncbi:glycosyltransferase family 2 protein [Streptococcus ruminantium]|uniref:Glycosyltransferase family 2 protein n=1 Tax=Streptococcus ruminantium TaxID=1917441 RepID=A0ABU1B4B2_9STRE|nr:glycosyltransferase family 2 protein [Streptococcus ruminantium]MDQ8759029.1 glycosyltransferase family 2 protein [Streptococcus ruminantium]MDQ8765477.1 glycosyltransferase family 2 protein [Streptococcus ruminantium]MDQ8768406.1 glycosyltransferase family 2 protein [Streptococcus ruminantium]MDQ8775170.1 glycosyltransferase family 2 protein [Streptococcus ruminantium]MDQ8793781.1 glycosyltransferase family 2 protein [Streptococcus ruminantium]
MTLLSIAIPSYNSEAYLHYCVQSLVIGGDKVEILIINDGSTDRTQEIAEELAAQFPNVRAIYQENKGHGGAVNRGIREASGRYFKVVDSDDWVDTRAYLKILESLQALEDQGTPVDAFISNFVYEKEEQSRKKSMSYRTVLPENRIFGWEDVGAFSKGQYIMMHSLIYRTELLREVGLVLPEHTFYVDNIFVFTPLQAVERMYYLPVDFYRYFIGRDDQSVNESVMIKRIDQQLKVNRILVDNLNLEEIINPDLRSYLLNHVEITTIISCALLNRAGTAEHMMKKQELWHYIRDRNPALFKIVRNGLLGQLTNLYGYPGRKISNAVYKIAKRIYGFN